MAKQRSAGVECARVEGRLATDWGTGAAVAALAAIYLAILRYLPGELLGGRNAEMGSAGRVAIFILGVVFAPLAEEYLFRGLLYRALDREWGGWRAVFGKRGLFCHLSPALSWIPVFALGVANALIFKRTGSLWPAVASHAVYNACVILI
jgi:membrane protease YdiL (CAAX protease family)